VNHPSDNPDTCCPVCRGDGELSSEGRQTIEHNLLAAWADDVLDTWSFKLAGRCWGMAPIYHTDSPYRCRLTWDHGSKDYTGNSAKEARIAAAEAIVLRSKDSYPPRPGVAPAISRNPA
jgi:hypothetical protein